MVNRWRRAQFLRHEDGIENSDPFFVNSSDGLVNLLLRPHGLVDQAFETSIKMQEHSKLVQLHHQHRIIAIPWGIWFW